jgi:MFS family permease
LRSFWILQAAITIQGLFYFIPSLYLPGKPYSSVKRIIADNIDYARTIGLSVLESSAIISVLNISGVPGVIVLSILCDHMSARSVIALSAAGSAVAIFLFWGLSSAAASLPLLMIFAIFYGFFAGGFTATFAAVAKETQSLAPEGSADIGSLFALISMARGIGNIACGPLSEALLQGQAQTMSAQVALKSFYSPLVIFTGVTAILTMSPWVIKQLRLI